MKFILQLIFWVIIPVSQVCATAQYPDTIILLGKRYPLLVNPIEGYFKQYPDKRPGAPSTALWRGYVAILEIRDSMLVVRDLEVPRLKSLPNGKYIHVIESIYKKIFSSDSLEAVTWFDGLLVIPCGTEVSHVNMGYASSYDHYILLQIRRGVLLKQKEMDEEEYRDFRKRQFEQFKKTPEFDALIKELNKESMSQEAKESFLFDYEIEYTSKYIVDF